MHTAASDTVLRAVAISNESDQPRGICIALSGGLDSSVLLHALASVRPRGLRAIHVHHGLHAEADTWAAHCEHACAALGVPLAIERVTVVAAGEGPEAAARQARHAGFRRQLGAGEWLALAHHRDDQAETFLLRALRASGPDGLAAMRRLRAFGRGTLWRPLLELPRTCLRAYADAHAIPWIEDPGNACSEFDRNFLRHEVMPLLRTRWPQADAAFAQAARLADDAHRLLSAGDEAELDRTRANGEPTLLRLSTLLRMAPTLRARVLRLWVRTLGLPPLPGSALAHIERDVLGCAPERNAAYQWGDARIERWGDLLHASTRLPPIPRDWARVWDGVEPLHLPDGSRLRLRGGRGFARPVRVRPRLGGERIDLPGRTHSTSLKKHLQAIGMPVWERRSLPLLLDPDSGTVLAAGDRVHSRHLARWLGHGDAACLEWKLA